MWEAIAKKMKVGVVSFDANKVMSIKLIGTVITKKTPQTLAYHCHQKFGRKFVVKSNEKNYYSK